MLFHFETAPLRQFLPGMHTEHDLPEVIARHITGLMMRALHKA